MTFCICSNCLTSRPTAWTVLPEPRAIRRGHREDDRLDAVELALVDVELAELLTHPGDHSQQARQRAHPADLLHLLEEIVERELALPDLALELYRLPLVHLALGLLGEGHDVAHPENALGHAIGVEALEV